MSDGWHQFQATLGHFLRLGGAHPLGDQQARESERGEKRRADADCDRERKTMHRTRPQKEQNECGDKRGKIGIHNGGKGAIKARFHRLHDGIALAAILAYTLIDQNMRIDRKADGQDETCNARKAYRSANERQNSRQDDDIDHKRNQGDDTQNAIGKHHEEADHQCRQKGRKHCRTRIILTERGGDGALFKHSHRLRQGARAQNHGHIIGGL
ncbi:Uncharacterised protein [Brucella melitensis]|nr:Uncharacterised protein [Brucella melitensis]